MSERLDILHHDNDVVVINKPSGLSVHRGWDREPIVAMTVLRDMLGRHVHPVHRLDRGTSGCLVFALARESIPKLQESIGDKHYLALVRGHTPDTGRIDHPVPNQHGKRVDAVTEYRRLGTFERYSLVEARPLTGRLHQIRRHLKHLSHPIIGDVRYGKGEHNRLFRSRFGLHRLALHAHRVDFVQPVSNEVIRVCAPVTEDLRQPLQAMDFALDELLSDSE